MTTATPTPSTRAATEAAERDRQVKQAEELLFSGPQRLGVGQGPLLGPLRRRLDHALPPLRRGRAGPKVEASLAELRAFCDANLDPEAIDRQADIPRSVIDGLAGLGVLGMTAPEAIGGRGFSQAAYCAILEELGRRCSSTSIFVNAHHSIGMRALLLFGTEEQKRRWLPGLIAGDEARRLRPDRARGRLRRRQRPDDRHARATTARTTS